MPLLGTGIDKILKAPNGSTLEPTRGCASTCASTCVGRGRQSRQKDRVKDKGLAGGTGGRDELPCMAELGKG